MGKEEDNCAENSCNDQPLDVENGHSGWGLEFSLGFNPGLFRMSEERSGSGSLPLPSPQVGVYSGTLHDSQELSVLRV